MYTNNKAQQSKNRVHISWDILYVHVAITRKGSLIFAIQGTDVPKKDWLNYQSKYSVHIVKFHIWFILMLIDQSFGKPRPDVFSHTLSHY